MDEIFKKEEGYKAPFHTAPKQCIVDGTFTLRLDVMVIKTHFSWNEGWEFDQIYLSFECQTYNTMIFNCFYLVFKLIAEFEKFKLELTEMGVFLFWTHFRLSLWMAKHLRMRSTTPSVYLDLAKGMLNTIE